MAVAEDPAITGDELQKAMFLLGPWVRDNRNDYKCRHIDQLSSRRSWLVRYWTSLFKEFCSVR